MPIGARVEVSSDQSEDRFYREKTTIKKSLSLTEDRIK